MPDSRDPNKHQHNFWIEDDLWVAASKRARERGENLTAAVTRFLTSYAKQGKGKP